jgi:hypothetical protein
MGVKLGPLHRGNKENAECVWKECAEECVKGVEATAQ